MSKDKSYVDLELDIDNKDTIEYYKDMYDTIEFNIKAKDTRKKPPCIVEYRLEGSIDDLKDIINSITTHNIL